MYCIETSELSYQYSRQGNELHRVNLRVKEGSIYGFLGPNGAGKTTTLKLILGLLKKQQGQIKVFGEEFMPHRLSVLSKIGSLIESPSLYSQLTATENLSVWQKLYACPKARIQEVLELVGLGQTGTKKAGQFSLGMKQRLGIATALLHNPSVLVLDEPTNGLDPSGMVEMRELLKRLNKEHGITILISSHLLSEIEKLVTEVGIINHGKMLFEGSLGELMQRQRTAGGIQLDTSNNAEAVERLIAQGLDARQEQGKIVLPLLARSEIAQLNRALVQHQLDVYEISTVESDLESIFMTLTHP